MISYRKELHFNLPRRRGLVNITRDVEKVLVESGIQEGLILVNAMNITASVLLMTMRVAYIRIMRSGWKNWRRKNPIASIVTMVMKITPMPI